MWVTECIFFVRKNVEKETKPCFCLLNSTFLKHLRDNRDQCQSSLLSSKAQKSSKKYNSSGAMNRRNNKPRQDYSHRGLNKLFKCPIALGNFCARNALPMPKKIQFQPKVHIFGRKLTLRCTNSAQAGLPTRKPSTVTIYPARKPVTPAYSSSSS